MHKRSVLDFIKNAAGVALVSSLVVASVAIASVTINNVGISGDSSFTNVTGTTSMVWDVGSGNTISLNTNNNGPVTFGTGLFSFTTASGTNLGLTGYLYSASVSSTNVSSTNVGLTGYLYSASVSSTNVSSTNVGLTGYMYSTNASTSNVSSTRLTAGTLIDTARIVSTNVSSTNATVSGNLQVTGPVTISASTTIATAIINTTSTALVAVNNCGTSPAVVGSPLAGLVTTGTGTITSCRIDYPTSTLRFQNPPSCVASYVTATTTGMYALAASSSRDFAIFANTSSTQSIAQLQISYICVGL